MLPLKTRNCNELNFENSTLTHAEFLALEGGRREGIEKGEEGRVGDEDGGMREEERENKRWEGRKRMENQRERTTVKRGRRKTLDFKREKYLPSSLWVHQLSPAVLWPVT